MRVSKESGKSFQLKLHSSDYDQTLINEKRFATVTKFPFPFHQREFVVRHIWKVDPQNDSVSVGVWPIDDVVDYGGGVGRIVRGTFKALFTASNIDNYEGVKQCEVVLHQVRDVFLRTRITFLFFIFF